MAPAVERVELAAGHHACPGTAAGPPSAAVPVPRALFSQKGIFWLLRAALNWRKKCLQTTLLLWEAGCTPELSGFNMAACSALPHAVDLQAARLGLCHTLGGRVSLPEPAEQRLSRDRCCWGGEGSRAGWAGGSGQCWGANRRL